MNTLQIIRRKMIKKAKLEAAQYVLATKAA